MKLSKDQIKELYAFVIKHHVVHYDVQTELVDHLANGIEAQWEANPQLTFKAARLKEFRKFGPAGFKKVIRKRKNAMSKKYLKIILTFFTDYFRLPKVLLTLGLIFLLTLALRIIPETYRYDSVLGLFFALVTVVLFIQFKKIKNNELEMVAYGRKLMLKDQIYSYGNLVNILNLIPITLNISYFRNLIDFENGYLLIAFSAMAVFMGLLSFVILFVIPKKAEELLEETYPEYKLL
jgi:hypothetical protein